MGPFLSLLPTEILFEVMSYLPLSDVGTLALTSYQLRNVVGQWIPSTRCLARSKLVNPPAFQVSNNGHPQSVQNILEMLVKDHQSNKKLNPFAVLCKRMTCLYNTRGRLRYAFQMFSKSAEFKKTSRKGCQTDAKKNREWEVTESTIRFMDMVHTFVRGWDESEFPLILCELDRKFRLGDKGRKVMSSNKREEACLASEMELRMYTRCLAWDLAGNDYGHRAAWLLAIMDFFVGSGSKVTNMDHVVQGQATMLTLMFGPACEDNSGHYSGQGEPTGPALSQAQKVVVNELNNHTDWSAFTETVAEDFHTGKAMFYGLAQAVCSCLSASVAWKEDFATRVVDKLFVTPKPWLRRNTSGFLLFCSESLILHYFGSKLGTESGLEEVATRLAEMILMSHKFDNELSHERGIGKVFDTLICQQPLTTGRLATQVWSRFADIVTQAEEEDDDDIDALEIMRCFGAHVMKTLAKSAKELKGNCLTTFNKVFEKKHPSSPMEESEQPQVKKAKLEEEKSGGSSEEEEEESSMDDYNEDDESEVVYQIED